MTSEMTAEEAKQWLDAIKKYYIHGGDEAYDKKRMKAVDKAIQALEQQPCDDCVSRSELQKTMDSLPLFRFVNNDHEEADDYYNCESVDMVIRSLPSVTPRRDLAETSQDCISREEVQELISRWLSDYLLDETREALETINYKVGDMPPVTPQRPKGKWIKIEYDVCTFIYKCSKCGMRVVNPYKYCPNCGAEMSGGGEDEVNNCYRQKGI